MLVAQPRRTCPRSSRASRRRSADTYFCNFSMFQSVPDAWAVDQLFPICPIHRLNEEPTRRATLADITCDSDGKIDSFIDLRDVKHVLELHPKPDGQDYYLGIFLVGAYQEILGDLHNLFGDTNTVHVQLSPEGDYDVKEVVAGDTVSEVLQFVDYSPSRSARPHAQQRRAGAAQEADDDRGEPHADQSVPPGHDRLHVPRSRVMRAALLALAVACHSDPTAARVRLVYDVDYQPPPSAADLAQAAETVRSMLATKLHGTVTVTVQGSQLAVDIDADQLDAIRTVIAPPHSLVFEVEDAGAPARVSAEVDQWRDDSGTLHHASYLLGSDRDALARAFGTVPADHELAFEHLADGRWRSYYLVRSTELTGKLISHAAVVDGHVAIDFGKRGATAFAAITTAHVGDKLAIVLDGAVIAAPIIMSAVTTGRVTVTVSAGTSAETLATSIDDAAKPTPLHEVFVTKR